MLVCLFIASYCVVMMMHFSCTIMMMMHIFLHNDDDNAYMYFLHNDDDDAFFVP